MREMLNESLMEGIAQVDISPTMFKEATDHYMAIAKLFGQNGLDADFYPQGSFSTGTVVRPYANGGEDSFYDLDMVCLVKDSDKESVSPGELMDRVVDILLGDGTYKDKCKITSECITIEYARSDSRPGFNLDIIVAVQPSGMTDLAYSLSGIELRWASQDLSIAVASPSSWKGSNPHALSDWFGEVNQVFADYDRDRRKAAILKKSRGVYASIEDIPVGLERSSLQRAIQIAKRARDLYYAHLKDGIRRPESCMLLVMLAEHAKEMKASSTALEILQSFCLKVLEAEILVGERIDCLFVNEGAYVVRNPVFPENFLEDWSDYDIRKMFSWIRVLSDDLSVNDNDFAMRNAALMRTVGDSAVKRIAMASPVASVSASVQQVKPWGGHGC